MVKTPLLITWNISEFGKTYKIVLKRRPPEEASSEGWLSVKVLYMDLPVADLSVQFYTLTEKHQKREPIGVPQITNKEGIARFAEPVEITFYGCEIENQPLAIVSPVEDDTGILALPLPISSPDIELFDSFAEALETLDEDEDENLN